MLLKKNCLGVIMGIFFIGSLCPAEDLNGRKHFSELLFEATYLIKGSGSGSGTAFCVSCGEGNTVYLLTARHVLDSMQGDSLKIFLRKKLADGTYSVLTQFQAIRDAGKPMYTTHPNSDIDLAALPMLIPRDSGILSQLYALPYTSFATEEDVHTYWIHPGDPLFFLGYPLGKASPSGSFPILRTGFVASYPLTPFEKTPTIFLDGPVFEGNSGGPVYFEYFATSWNSRTVNQKGKILGLIYEYKYAKTVRKIDDDNTLKKHDLQVGGFVNSGFIIELLDSLNCQ